MFMATKTVDQVVQAFQKTISDLQTVATQQLQRAADHEEAVQRERAAQLAAKAEAERAEGIAAKLKAIFEA